MGLPLKTLRTLTITSLGGRLGQKMTPPPTMSVLHLHLCVNYTFLHNESYICTLCYFITLALVWQTYSQHVILRPPFTSLQSLTLPVYTLWILTIELRILIIARILKHFHRSWQGYLSDKCVFSLEKNVSLFTNCLDFGRITSVEIVRYVRRLVVLAEWQEQIIPFILCKLAGAQSFKIYSIMKPNTKVLP